MPSGVTRRTSSSSSLTTKRLAADPGVSATVFLIPRRRAGRVIAADQGLVFTDESAQAHHTVAQWADTAGDRTVATTRDAILYGDRNITELDCGLIARRRRDCVTHDEATVLRRGERDADHLGATCTPSPMNWIATSFRESAAPARPGDRALKGSMALKRCVTARAPASKP